MIFLSEDEDVVLLEGNFGFFGGGEEDAREDCRRGGLRGYGRWGSAGLAGRSACRVSLGDAGHEERRGFTTENAEGNGGSGGDGKKKRARRCRAPTLRRSIALAVGFVFVGLVVVVFGRLVVLIWVAALGGLFVLQGLGLRVVLLLHGLELLSLFLVELLHLLSVRIWLALDFLLLGNLSVFELLALGVLLRAQLVELLLVLLVELGTACRQGSRSRVWRTIVEVAVRRSVGLRLIRGWSAWRRLIWTRSVRVHSVVHGLDRARVVVQRRLTGTYGRVGRLRWNR